VTDADMLGRAAQASAAQRTHRIDAKTDDYGRARRVVKFVSNGQEFRLVFDGHVLVVQAEQVATHRSSRIGPDGLRRPNARDLADK